MLIYVSCFRHLVTFNSASWNKLYINLENILKILTWKYKDIYHHFQLLSADFFLVTYKSKILLIQWLFIENSICFLIETSIQKLSALLEINLFLALNYVLNQLFMLDCRQMNAVFSNKYISLKYSHHENKILGHIEVHNSILLSKIMLFIVVVVLKVFMFVVFALSH